VSSWCPSLADCKPVSFNKSLNFLTDRDRSWLCSHNWQRLHVCDPMLVRDLLSYWVDQSRQLSVTILLV